MNMKRAVAVSFFLACTAFLISAGALAQYPSKPVRIVVPSPAGGPGDIFIRHLGQSLAKLLEQPVVVENIVGANGMIGAQAVANSAADGYTLLTGNFGTHAANPALYRKLPYDPVRDFTPISLLALFPYVLVVHPDTRTTTLVELVALARSQPGKLNYATSDAPAVVAMELLKRAYNFDVVQVPYKQTTQAVLDVITGKVNMMVLNLIQALPQIQAGKLRALASMTPRRVSPLPDVPSIGELGHEDLSLYGFLALYGPAGMPKEAVDRLNIAVRQALTQGDLKSLMAKQGVIVENGTSPNELAAFTAEQIVAWGRYIREAGIKAQ